MRRSWTRFVLLPLLIWNFWRDSLKHVKGEKEMTLILGRLGTKPHDLEIKTGGFGGLPDVQIGDYEISMKDFLLVVHYVLTNTNLEPDDPRLQFVKCVQSMQKIDGWGGSGKRLEDNTPPVI